MAHPADPSAPAALTRSRPFLAFWAGQGISQLGVQLGQIALPVLAVQLLGAGELELGMLNAAAMAAFLVIGLPAGAWVDRWLKRRTMIAADLVRMAAMLAVPALWAAGVLELWHLYAVAAVLGVATVFFDVAYQSYIPLLVAPALVPAANGRLEATAQVARLGGPALGGAFLTVLSAPLLFLAEGLGYLASALFLTRVTDSETPHSRAPGSRLAAEIREGAAFVVRHPLIRRVALSTAGFNLFSSLVFVLVPLVVLRELDLGPLGLGLILSVGSVGGIVAALAVPRLAALAGEGPLIPLGALMGAAATVLLPVSLGVRGVGALVLLCAAEALMAFGVVVYNVMQVSMRQRVCPTGLLGRMNASIRFFVWGVMPLGSLAGGWLGENLGIGPALWIGVAGQALASLPVVLGPFFALRTLPDTVDDAASLR
ncbi:MFS transporter [Sinomonas halotolerans]|uniref:MFS transporter n=1 Tax=Sinomonas halotolerans TaxID=1644133 RepID=A0ABU9WW61_9MICC